MYFDKIQSSHHDSSSTEQVLARRCHLLGTAVQLADCGVSRVGLLGVEKGWILPHRDAVSLEQ